MIKKAFVSLCLGLGATLGVFIALAMPPGGWGVLLGVLAGMLSCVFVLLGVFIALRFGGGGGGRRGGSDNSEPRSRTSSPGQGQFVLVVTPQMLAQAQAQGRQTQPRSQSFYQANNPPSLPASFDNAGNGDSSVIEGQARAVNQARDYFWE